MTLQIAGHVLLDALHRFSKLLRRKLLIDQTHKRISHEDICVAHAKSINPILQRLAIETSSLIEISMQHFAVPAPLLAHRRIQLLLTPSRLEILSANFFSA